MTTKTKSVAGLIVVIAAFLIGFLPQYLEKTTLAEHSAALEAALTRAEIRDLCGMMLLEVLEQNYGLAREHSTKYFEAVRQAVEDVENPVGPPLREMLNRRDSITAFLAQNDPASTSEIQALCRQTDEITKP